MSIDKAQIVENAFNTLEKITHKGMYCFLLETELLPYILPHLNNQSAFKKLHELVDSEFPAVFFVGHIKTAHRECFAYGIGDEYDEVSSTVVSACKAMQEAKIGHSIWGVIASSDKLKSHMTKLASMVDEETGTSSKIH